MLTKFISVSKTRFQNTETALKNQQASIQGLETQIGQLAKLISEQPQGGLPSNTKTNPREQLHAITVYNDERLVEDEPKLRQDNVVDNGKESPRKNVIEFHSNPCNKNKVAHDERRLQINELDEWRTRDKEKPKVHDESKRHYNERRDETKQFKVGDKVLLDEKDLRIATSELNTNGVTPFTVLNVFPYGTVEVHHSKFGTFKEK
ncbi:hypothetical protein GOBAR_AA13612 [Gossypium barbadense]|uniref:Uncharacterized protein n=1 Tax=Gossypium barbadense TaxID=3634 RepID=A0A2P5XUL2_GOSBA|nr:hypothetical protein GOBAR_AA13612 [Gossypium barbadense]